MRVLEVLEDYNFYYIVTEELEEELSKRLYSRGMFTERDAAVIFQQILMALNYMHSRNIVHRDVKLENVLMQTKNKDDLAIKLTDFGFAKIFYKERGLTDILGSPLYMAPEILRKKPYGTAVDIWAAGVLLHILIIGEPPYIAETKKEIFEMIRNKEVPFKKELWEKVSPTCCEFVMSMLNKDPAKRPTAA